jgi:hypothetical protein
MRGTDLRRVLVSASILAAGALVAACGPQGPVPAPTVPTGNFQFKALSAKNVSSNDESGCFLGICVNPSTDEPYPINIAFTVQIGVPGSATAHAVVGDQHWDWFNPFDQGPDEGETYTFSNGGEQAPVNLSNVPLLDVADLAFTSNHLEVAGVWSWALEGDTDPIGPGGMADTVADGLKAALNSTLAVGSLPSDPSDIVNSVLGVIGSHLFPTIGSFLSSVVPWGDDGMGSRMYIGLGARGTLKSIIDSSTASVSFPSIAIPVVKIPPDIDGGAIFSLGSRSFTGQVMTNGSVQGRHDYAFSLTQL